MSRPPPQIPPAGEPPPGGPTPDPVVRPFYYPLALSGCLLWFFVLLFLYLLIGWLFAPTWYRWWW
jgi:hypothetical protein